MIILIIKKKFNKPEGWLYIDRKVDSKTGLLTEAYKSPTNEIVMVVHGIDITSNKDWESNIQLISKELPNQASSAYEIIIQTTHLLYQIEYFIQMKSDLKMLMMRQVKNMYISFMTMITKCLKKRI